MTRVPNPNPNPSPNPHQSLYMTPEFRAALYEWRYAGPRTVCA